MRLRMRSAKRLIAMMGTAMALMLLVGCASSGQPDPAQRAVDAANRADQAAARAEAASEKSQAASTAAQTAASKVEQAAADAKAAADRAEAIAQKAMPSGDRHRARNVRHHRRHSAKTSENTTPAGALTGDRALERDFEAAIEEKYLFPTRLTIA
jgi:hypothetical protein